MNSGNQNNDSNNITTKPNETKTPSQGNKNTSVKSKQNPNKQLPIFIALAIIFVLCITGIIVSLSINKNSTSQEDFSATILENFCNNNNGYFIEDDNNNNINVKKEKKNKFNNEIEKDKMENILNKIQILGYDINYVKNCLKDNIICHATAVYYLMMNYENF